VLKLLRLSKFFLKAKVQNKAIIVVSIRNLFK